MSIALLDFSEALVGAVASAAVRIVRVEGRERLTATGIVWDDEGLIVIFHHGLERDDNIDVGFQNGESVGAELVGRDPSTDVALLRTPTRGFAVPSWAANLRVFKLAT